MVSYDFHQPSSDVDEVFRSIKRQAFFLKRSAPYRGRFAQARIVLAVPAALRDQCDTLERPAAGACFIVEFRRFVVAHTYWNDWYFGLGLVFVVRNVFFDVFKPRQLGLYLSSASETSARSTERMSADWWLLGLLRP